MSLNISDHFRQTFADSFREIPQQTNTRLRKSVVVKTGLTGVGQQIDHILPSDGEETTGQRYKKVNLKDLETDMRWYFPREFQHATGESKWDEKKLAPTVMPGGKHINAHGGYCFRVSDKLIMEELLGDARTGKTGGTLKPLPSSQIIPVDFVPTGSDADSSITVPKIIEGVRALKKSEAWNEDKRAMGVKLWGVLDSDLEARLKQLANTNGGDRLFSKDFDPPVYDKDGTLIYWMGIHWISYEGLLTGTAEGASGNVSVKKVPIYTSEAFEFGVWQDIQTSVDRRPDLSNAVQFLSQFMIGGGRAFDEAVVQINCKV